MTDWPYTDATRAAIAANLARYRRRVEPGADLRAAAVSVVLAPAERGPGTCFLLTLRAPRLNAHAGQYALPGGKVDEGEDALGAARRELHEELAVETAPEQVLGVLDDLPTRSGFLITPFVIWAGTDVAPRPHPGEIARLHRIPLADLFAGRGRGGNSERAAGSEREPGVFSLFIPALGHDLFAPTAAMMDHFREVALMGHPTPAVRFGEPAFARR